MIARRLFLTRALGLALAPAAAAAARAGDAPPRIGFLAPGTRAAAEPFVAAFRRGLGGHGLVEDVDIRIDWCWMDEPDGGAEAAAAIVRGALRLAVAPTRREVELVRRANPALPVVMVAVGDPVGRGLARSLQRPGGLVTGLTDDRSDFAARRLRLLRDLSPRIRRVAFLRDPDSAAAGQTASAAATAGMTLLPLDLRRTADLEPALASLAGAEADALLVAPDPMGFAHRARIAAAATQHRLPALFGYADVMDVDALMAFGAELEHLYVQAARYVRDILRGMPPGELPILPPSRVELAINLRLGRQLGITVPPALLAKADRLIE